MTKWVRYPGPGEYRGQGRWVTLEETGWDEAYWQGLKDTGFLPTHEGDEPPPEVADVPKGE